MLSLYGNDKDFFVWACENRNSDDILIVTGGLDDKDINNKYGEEAYKNSKSFKCDDFYSAIDYVMLKVEMEFSKELKEPANIKFTMNKDLESLRHINLDAEELEYDDYFDLATYEDMNESIFCDLIIMNHKIGLRFSKWDNGRNDCENITFKEWQPNLESETTLMLGMKNKLEDFIDAEKEYSLTMQENGVKI